MPRAASVRQLFGRQIGVAIGRERERDRLPLPIA